MSGYYQTHKQQANARVQARLQEVELHRLAKEGAPKRGFSLFSAAKKLFGGQKATASADQKQNVLGAPSR
jgi:hypothetical protein